MAAPAKEASGGTVVSQSSVESRAKSMEFLLDEGNKAAVLPPENELQKVGVGSMGVGGVGAPLHLSEHQLRVQRSLQKLNVPEWYLRSAAGGAHRTHPESGASSPLSLLERRHSSGRRPGGGWPGLASKTTSLSSLQTRRSPTPTRYAAGIPPTTPTSRHLLSPGALSSGGPSPDEPSSYSSFGGATPRASFSRWSTSRLHQRTTLSLAPSAPTSPRSSFSAGRTPYLGWRSQERLLLSDTSPHYRTPSERLAADLLASRRAAAAVAAAAAATPAPPVTSSPVSAATPSSTSEHVRPAIAAEPPAVEVHPPAGKSPELSDVRSSITEVTSAIVHYVSERVPGEGGKKSPSTSLSGRPCSPRQLCWVESSFVGTRPIDSPQTPPELGDGSRRSSSATAAVVAAAGGRGLTGEVESTPNGPVRDLDDEVCSVMASGALLEAAARRAAVHLELKTYGVTTTASKPEPNPAATLEDVLDSLLGLPPASSRSPSPASPASPSRQPIHVQTRTTSGATEHQRTTTVPSKASTKEAVVVECPPVQQPHPPPLPQQPPPIPQAPPVRDVRRRNPTQQRRARNQSRAISPPASPSHLQQQQQHSQTSQQQQQHQQPSQQIQLKDQYQLPQHQYQQPQHALPKQPYQQPYQQPQLEQPFQQVQSQLQQQYQQMEQKYQQQQQNYQPVHQQYELPQAQFQQPQSQFQKPKSQFQQPEVQFQQSQSQFQQPQAQFQKPQVQFQQPQSQFQQPQSQFQQPQSQSQKPQSQFQQPQSQFQQPQSQFQQPQVQFQQPQVQFQQPQKQFLPQQTQFQKSQVQLQQHQTQFQQSQQHYQQPQKQHHPQEQFEPIFQQFHSQQHPLDQQERHQEHQEQQKSWGFKDGAASAWPDTSLLDGREEIAAASESVLTEVRKASRLMDGVQEATVVEEQAGSPSDEEEDEEEEAEEIGASQREEPVSTELTEETSSPVRTGGSEGDSSLLRPRGEGDPPRRRVSFETRQLSEESQELARRRRHNNRKRSRVAALCRRAAAAATAPNSPVLPVLSRVARQGFLSRGRGCVKIFFSGPERAEAFTSASVRASLAGVRSPSEGEATSTALAELGEPAYAGWADLPLPSGGCGERCYRDLVQLCRTYDPDSKLVLLVCVCVSSAETPGAGKWSRKVVSRCTSAKLGRFRLTSEPEYHLPRRRPTEPPPPPPRRRRASTREGADPRPGSPITREMEYPETLVLRELPPACSSTGKRETAYGNVRRQLKRRGVSLRKQFPDVHRRLRSYVEDGVAFAPAAIHPRDGLTGRPFLCVILPEGAEEPCWDAEEGGGRLKTVDLGAVDDEDDDDDSTLPRRFSDDASDPGGS